MKTFPELLQAYFTERLMEECNASHHTIANYRDTFRLLIAYAQKRLKKPPTKLAIQDLDATFVLGFLEYLEKTAATPRAAGTCGCRRSIRSLLMQPFRNPPSRQWHNGS